MLITIKTLLLYGAFVSGNAGTFGVENNYKSASIERRENRRNETFRVKQGYELLSKATYAENVDNDYEGALELKRQACDLGIGKACWYYAFQTDDFNDYSRAQEILTNDCFANKPNVLSAESCTYLGIMTSQEKTQGQVFEVARLYDMGCKLGDGWGCYRLARDTLNNSNYDEALNINKKAINILEKQCNANIGSSCYLLGCVYEQPFSENWLDYNTRMNRAKVFFERGCNLKDGDACEALQQLF